MFRIVRFALILPLAVALTGCASSKKTVYCGTCKQNMKVGAYCSKCRMIMGEEGTVHCDKCNKDLPAGSWCEKCNRFMLTGMVHCSKCNKDVPRGTFCSCCDKYVGVPDVRYCKGCKAPCGKECKGCANATKS